MKRQFTLLWAVADDKLLLFVRCGISIRDVVAATELFVSCVDRAQSVGRALYHAFSATILDALGAMPTRMSFDRLALVDDSIREV